MAVLAARVLAEAADLVLAEQPPAAPLAPGETGAHALPGSAPGGARVVAVNFTVSPACLLGVCRGGACHSPLCEHACHSRPA